MKIRNRKLSALFLAAIMLLQVVLTIPLDVFADTTEEQRGTVVETVSLVRENGEKAELSYAEEKLILQIEWSHSSSGENPLEETVIRLPEELTAETGEYVLLDHKDTPSGMANVKENEISIVINQKEEQLRGTLEIPVQLGEMETGNHTLRFYVNEEYKTVEIVIEELNENQVIDEIAEGNEESVDIIEEEATDEQAEAEKEESLLAGSLEVQEQEPLVSILGVDGPSEINADQFKFNNIYFLDNTFNEEVDDPKDFIFDVDRPYDLNIKDNYGLLYFDFSLIDGHTVKAGDTFTFKLPEKLKPVRGISGLLGSLGKWFVQEDGTVKFEFGEGVNADDVEGHFWFSVYLDENKMDETIIQKVRFETNPDFLMTFPVKPLGGSLLNKVGTINNNGYNSSEAYWTVDINTSLDKLFNASVSDVIPANMKLKEGSVEVYRLGVSSGGVKTIGTLLEADRYELSILEGNPNVSFSGLTDEEASKAYRIIYTTEISQPAEGFDGIQTFINKVVLINDGKNYTSASTVSSGYAKALEKLGQKNQNDMKNPPIFYDETQQTFLWIINYNYNQQMIEQSKASLTDTWNKSGVMELVPEEFGVYEVNYDASGEAVVSQTPIDSALYTLTENGKDGFTLLFKDDVEYQAYQIRYKTKLLGTKGFGIVDVSGSVTNTVVTGTDKSAESGGAWSQRGVIKSSTGADVKEKEIYWRILLNQNSYLMVDLVVTDTFTGDGLTMLTDTFKITGQDRTYELGVDYELEYTAPVFGTSSGGFVITFNEVVNEPLTVTYTTNFERNKDGSGTYKNKADINYEVDGRPYTNNANEVTVRPGRYTAPNGVKNGYYNANTKEITWSIHTNYARLVIESGYKISDLIPQHQEMVEGSLEVFTYDVDSAGTITGEVSLDAGSYSVVDPADNENKLEVTLADSFVGTRGSIGIRFRTKFIGEWIRDTAVANKAEFTNGADSFMLEATVTIPHGKEYILKTGKLAGSFSERVDWTVYINRSQSLIKGYTLTDNPDLNSVLLEDTFKVYKTVVSENGTVTRSAEMLIEGTDYDLQINTDNETGKQNFILKFTDDIRDAYILEYSSYIDPLVGGDEAISNKYTAEGTTLVEISAGDLISKVGNENSGGAGGDGIRGGLEIRKIDEKNPESVLGGALFNLYTKDGAQILRTGITDAEGLVKFGGLRRGEYLLREIEAPKEYVISRDLAEGVIVTLTHENDGQFELFTYENARTKVNLEKVDENSIIISDEAIFDLYREDGTLKDQNFKTSNGLLTIEHLEEGEYYLKETKAPEGYILNTSKMNFTIKINADGTQDIPTVTVFNYKGSVELIKTDKDENPLQDALFTLYDENDVVIMENLKSDEDGRIHADELSPGKYYFQEESAPNGFIRNTEKIHFTIVENGSGEPELIAVEAINYKGSVKLMKLDQLGDILAGAEFELRNEETDQIIAESLTTDVNGVIIVTDLAPGKYTFLELSAPEGYMTNKEPLSFTVGEEYEGVPEIILAGEITNYKGSAVLEKTDEEGNLLEGVLFNVLDGEGNLVQSELRSDEEGKIFVEQLSPGKYQFVETAAPEGYMLNLETVSFEISNENYGAPVMVNAGTLINYRGKAVLIKTDESGTVLQDALFNVTDENGTVILENLYSDENGVVTADELAPGKYYFEETKAPEGFIRNELKIAFSIMDENEGKPETVEAGSLQNYKGSAMWHKVRDKGEGLEGALFEVRDVEGNTVYEDLSSDENGKVTIDGLAPGVYTILETRAPSGYIRNLDTLTFVIESEAEGKPEMITSENFVNYQGKVILTKTDDMGQPLEGATFELSLNGEMVSLWTTDEDGKIFIENLQPGKYSLVEVESPEGYILDQTSYDFVISDEEHGEPMTIQAGHAMNHKGSMVLKKVDENGQLLEGALFEIRDAEEKLISRIESDGQGLVKVSGLAPGHYTVKEIKAPKGYIRNTEMLSFTIGALSMGKPEVINLENFVNYSGTLQVLKVDSKGNPLKNAEFEILDANGDTYREKLISDENGKIMISGIAPGRYSLVEVNAPKGYMKNDQKYDFEIIEYHEGEPAKIMITVVNEKMAEEEFEDSLPKAGTKESAFYFNLLGMLFIAAGFIYLNKQKKRA